VWERRRFFENQTAAIKKGKVHREHTTLALHSVEKIEFIQPSVKHLDIVDARQEHDSLVRNMMPWPLGFPTA
jgi:hypothetical protein